MDAVAEHAGARRDPGLDAAVPFRFACSRCGHCCSGGDGYAWVEDDEVGGLARALDMSAESFVALHVREAADPRGGARRLALRERGDGRCTLLEGRDTCRAYDARPRHCRDFPYWPSVMRGGAGFESARATCPGIAVEVDAERAAAAFDRLEALYAELDGAGARADCCLAGPAADDLYVSALEADHARHRGRADATCRLGPARPLGCRLAGADADVGESARERLRAIQRDTGHPAAYGPARALLAARGVVAAEERA